jgi:hypothetical protein
MDRDRTIHIASLADILDELFVGVLEIDKEQFGSVVSGRRTQPLRPCVGGFAGRDRVTLRVRSAELCVLDVVVAARRLADLLRSEDELSTIHVDVRSRTKDLDFFHGANV